MGATLTLAALGDALSRGEVVAFPGASGWLALSRASERERLAALPGVDRAEISLTAGSAATLADFLPPLGLRAQRVVQRLLPGPVAIRLGSGGPIVRLPDHLAWTALLTRREPLLLVPLAGACCKPSGCTTESAPSRVPFFSVRSRIGVTTSAVLARPHCLNPSGFRGTRRRWSWRLQRRRLSASSRGRGAPPSCRPRSAPSTALAAYRA